MLRRCPPRRSARDYWAPLGSLDAAVTLATCLFQCCQTVLASAMTSPFPCRSNLYAVPAGRNEFNPADHPTFSARAGAEWWAVEVAGYPRAPCPPILLIPQRA